MPRSIRPILIAALLLVTFFSLPLWLPELRATGQSLSPEPTQATTTKPSELSAQLAELDPGPLTILDAGWITGNYQTQVLVAPAIWRWQPGAAHADWRQELGFVNGAYSDEAEGLIYLVERRHPEEDSLQDIKSDYSIYSASGGWPLFLTVLDAESGELIERIELDDIPAGDEAALYIFPIARRGQTLYLRNYESYGLFSYDLQSGNFNEERGKLCDEGYPFDSYYLAKENALITFCSFHSSDPPSNLSKLSLDDGSISKVELPMLGPEEYMSGNGFAMTQAGMAYVVDSDGGSLAVVDLNAMQVLEKAEYRPDPATSSRLQNAGDWLLDLAASPAHAKRWMSSPAVSADGRYLAVDGGFGIGSGVTKSVWLIDLESLETVQEIKLPGSPQDIFFSGDGLLYVLMMNQHPAKPSEVLVFDIGGQASLLVELPGGGRLTDLLP